MPVPALARSRRRGKIEGAPIGWSALVDAWYRCPTAWAWGQHLKQPPPDQKTPFRRLNNRQTALFSGLADRFDQRHVSIRDMLQTIASTELGTEVAL